MNSPKLKIDKKKKYTKKYDLSFVTQIKFKLLYILQKGNWNYSFKKTVAKNAKDVIKLTRFPMAIRSREKKNTKKNKTVRLKF